MGFLAPLWFVLGAAAAVPLLVHLLRRRTGATTEFPAARYLLRAEREHSRSIRLRNLLLMLLRVVAVLLLTLAAARPVGQLLAGASGHGPTALAVVLDNSLSTAIVDGGAPVFESLRAAARRAVSAATADDRIHLVTADGRVRTGSRESVLASIDGVRTLPSAGDLPGAVRRASAVVRASAPTYARRILVVTDGQRSAWDEAIDVPEGLRVGLFTLPGAAPVNRGVALATPRPARWTPSGALDVRLHARDSTPVRVRLEVPGARPRTVARAVVPPRETAALRVATSDTGWLVGRVEIDGDELPGDDARHFAVWAGAAPGVRVMPGAGPFVRSAVDALRGTGAVRAGDDVIILSADELRLGSPSVLVVPPTDVVHLGAANAALARAGIPWRFGARNPAGAVRLADGTELPVRLSYSLVSTATTAVDTIATVAGRPWAVGGAHEGTRYVVIASPLVPEATDLPVRATFVPWVASIVAAQLVGTGAILVESAPAAPVQLPGPIDTLVPAGGGAAVVGDPPLTAPDAPGVYFARGAGATRAVLVVNVEESESVMERWQGETLGQRIRGAETMRATDGDVADLAFGDGGTRSLATPVLAMALLVLSVEAVIAAVRARGTV